MRTAGCLSELRSKMSIARIRKDDTVIVIAGEDAGKTGKVLRVMPAKGQAIVEGLNKIKKAIRRSQVAPEGGFIDRESPIPLSNLMPFDPDKKKGSRIGRVVEGGKTLRKFKTSGKIMA